MADGNRITDLERLVADLPAAERARFERIYDVTATVGELYPPDSLKPWLEERFGSIETVARQHIVRVTNRVTHEGVLYNELRSARPHLADDSQDIAARMETAHQRDIFATPEIKTPEDGFGRVEGKYCLTASNLAKNDGLHAVIIFREFDPLRFSREQVVDYIDTGREWARRAQAAHPEARYFFFFWNCLWRAGASMVHGHAQVMLTTDRHYPRIEGLRAAAEKYRQEHGADYFDDLFRAHWALGLARERDGVRVLISLTPFKYNDVIVTAAELSLPFKERVYDVLAGLRDRMEMETFNLGLVTPPLAPAPEDWWGFPVLARVVDRGNLQETFSDVGGVEVFAASVVSSDPFRLAETLWPYLEEVDNEQGSAGD